MDVNISLITAELQDIKKYKTLFEKIDEMNYSINIEGSTLAISKDFDNSKDTIEFLINEFLNVIDIEFIISAVKELRLGIFYSHDEFAFLSLEFSKQLISKLNTLSLNIEINTYIS